MKKKPADKFIHIRSVIERGLLPMTRDYLYRLVKKGEIPHFKFGNRYYMTQEQIDQVIAENEINPKSTSDQT